MSPDVHGSAVLHAHVVRTSFGRERGGLWAVSSAAVGIEQNPSSSLHAKEQG